MQPAQPIHILWDASHIWGLMAWRALRALGLSCRLVKGQEIAEGALLGKPGSRRDAGRAAPPPLLVVPGGNARLKALALGEAGRAAVRAYLERGGSYLGFCGGAGLALSHRDPREGKVTTGGIVTVKDSSWLLSWTLNRQQQFRDQPKNQLCVWVYGLFSDKPGDYVKKPMRDCTGREICMEWLYHIGVPEDQIAELAEHSANTVPVMMPYIDAFFMPRAMGDRPDVVPEGAVNFAFLGQFAETARDTIFTTEYSMRTGMEAVYTLLNIDRGVPEVWGSTYDVRALIDATVKLRDGKKITDMDLPLIPRLALKEALKKIEGTDLEKFLKEYNAI